MIHACSSLFYGLYILIFLSLVQIHVQIKLNIWQKTAACTWFEALEGNYNSCVSCFTLQKKGGHFGITIEPRPDGQLVVSNVSPDLQAGVRVSDR